MTDESLEPKNSIAEVLGKFLEKSPTVEILEAEEPIVCIPDGVSLRTLKDVRFPNLRNQPQYGTTVESSNISALTQFLENYATSSTVLTSSRDKREYTSIVNYYKPGSANIAETSIARADFQFKLTLEPSAIWQQINVEEKSRESRSLISWIRKLGETLEFNVDPQNLLPEKTRSSLSAFLDSAESFQHETAISFITEEALIDILHKSDHSEAPDKFLVSTAMEVFESAGSDDCVVQFTRTKSGLYTAHPLEADQVEKNCLNKIERKIRSGVPDEVQVFLASDVSLDSHSAD